MRTQRPRQIASLRVGRRRRAHVVVALSNGTVQRLDLAETPISFGRGSDNTVLIDDDYTSTHHARISARERGWVVEDCGSTNGTWVDRKRITSPTPLAPGMKVRIGRSEITVGS
jgi:pSer/pThr/pTyr-binding forkhead associated (FHA) protein